MYEFGMYLFTAFGVLTLLGIESELTKIRKAMEAK